MNLQFFPQHMTFSSLSDAYTYCITRQKKFDSEKYMSEYSLSLMFY